MWHAERHALRLARDARLLGLGEVDVARARALLEELAAPSRGGDALRIRVEAHGEASGVRLRGAATALEADPLPWRAITSRMPHPGPSQVSAAKRIERAYWDEALAQARSAGAHEALLFAADGHLVEGGRTNVVVSRRDGALVTPPLARGGQAGIARAILLERCSDLSEADVTAADVAAAREIVAVNALRGACAIGFLDGRRVGAGGAGPAAELLARVLLES